MLALPLAVTLALAPTGATAMLEVSFGAEYDGTVLTAPADFTGDANERHVSNGGDRSTPASRVFGSPVRDDEAPPALQPYLQRATEFHLEGGGGAYHFVPGPSAVFFPSNGTTGYDEMSVLG